MAFGTIKNRGLAMGLGLVNIILLAILLCVGAHLAALSAERAEHYGKILEEQPYDINPGREYVLYTNYACPHCAALHLEAEKHGLVCTTRILMLEDGGEAFSTQRIVSGFMLKLSRTDAKRFDQMEDALFRSQEEWTALDDRAALAWLNERSGMSWGESDLTDEIEACESLKEEAPDDIEYVPFLFSKDGPCDTLLDELLELGGDTL